MQTHDGRKSYLNDQVCLWIHVKCKFKKKEQRSFSLKPFLPRGICTNELGHILIADENNHGIHVLDKDGGFLTMLTIPGNHGSFRFLSKTIKTTSVLAVQIVKLEIEISGLVVVRFWKCLSCIHVVLLFLVSLVHIVFYCMVTLMFCLFLLDVFRSHGV